MNAFIASIGKALNVWPQTDYEEFIPKVMPTTEAWYRTQLSINANLCKIELANSQLKKAKAQYCFACSKEDAQ